MSYTHFQPSLTFEYYQHSWALRLLRHHILTFGPTWNKDNTVVVSLVSVDLMSYVVQTISLTCDKWQTSHILAQHALHDLPTNNTFTHVHILVLYSPILNSYSPHFILPLLCFLPPYTPTPPQEFKSDRNLHPTVIVKSKVMFLMFCQNDKEEKQ
jgi:hypothetical protein